MDTSQLLKGVLDVAVLAVVAEADGYGYDVVRRLRSRGLEDVADASVYGTLRRLYATGSLTSYVVPSDEGPHRKYYGVTPAGLRSLEEGRGQWAEFSRSLDAILANQSDPAKRPDVSSNLGATNPAANPSPADTQESPIPAESSAAAGQ